MVKSAGFLKKLKKVGSLVGKGAKWVNDNVIKPLNPVIDNALDFVPYGNTIRTVKNHASRLIDRIPGSVKQDKRFQNMLTTGTDYLLDTQRSEEDRKYYSPFGDPLN